MEPMGARGRKSKAELMVVQSESPTMSESSARSISASSSVPPPPKDLGVAGKRLWQKITAEFELDGAAEVEQFYRACRNADRADDLRRRIDADGVMIELKTGKRDNPLLKHEIACHAFINSTLRHLFPRSPDEKPPRYRSSPGYYG